MVWRRSRSKGANHYMVDVVGGVATAVLSATVTHNANKGNHRDM